MFTLCLLLLLLLLLFSSLATPDVALIVASAVAVDSAVASVAPVVNLVVVSAEHATN